MPSGKTIDKRSNSSIFQSLSHTEYKYTGFLTNHTTFSGDPKSPTKAQINTQTGRYFNK